MTAKQSWTNWSGSGRADAPATPQTPSPPALIGALRSLLHRIEHTAEEVDVVPELHALLNGQAGPPTPSENESVLASKVEELQQQASDAMLEQARLQARLSELEGEATRNAARVATQELVGPYKGTMVLINTAALPKEVAAEVKRSLKALLEAG